MSHVAPHRWADARAGRVTPAERATMDAHAAACRACSRSRARVMRASDTFTTIRTQPAPELPWDGVRARVHWSVSKERREQGAPRRATPKLGWIAFGLTAAAALVATLGVDPPAAQVTIAPTPAPPSASSASPAPVARASRPAAVVGLVNRATGEVMIDGIRPNDLFARRLVAGSVIATGDGRVDVQFGDASAFGLEPRSTLELRRFDAEVIELVVRGTVDIKVAPRRNGQRFLVIAGERTVEVRGTQFRVRHDAATAVACAHGLVVVRDQHGQLEVGAARHVAIAADRRVGDDRAAALSVDEVVVLANATPMTLPVWDADALATSSAPLEITTSGRREVRVDGVELGFAPMRVRVMPGRHTVEAADSAGRYRRAGWIDVGAPSATTQGAQIVVLPEPPATRGIDARRRQLHAGIDKARLGTCVRRIVKAGPAGTYVQIEIAVDSNGAVGFLNVIDTDLGSATASCVRDVLADVRFGTGAAATWRERVDL